MVIGNPPYNKERDNAQLFEPIKKSNYQKYYQGKMDFWYLFLHRAIDIVKEKGHIGFITNSYWTKGSGAKTLIERIKNEITFTHIIDFDSLPVFQGVSGKHMIHMYKKEKASKSKKTKYLKVENLNFSIEGIDDKKAEKIESNQLIKDNLTISFDSSINIFEGKNYQKLDDLFEVSQGVVEATDKISKNQLKENTNFKVGDGVFVLNKNEVKELNLNEDEKKLLKKYLNTSHVNRYGIDFKDEYLIYSDKLIKEEIKSGKYPNMKGHLDKMKQFITSSNQPYGLHRFRKREFFENPKLICKGMFKTPEFYYDKEGYFVGFSFSVIINKEPGYSLKFLLGLMNSKLGEIWFERYGKKRGVGVDIGVGVFREFPIPIVSESQQKPIIDLVDQMLLAQKKLKEAEFDDDKKIIEKQIEIIDRKIDDMVFDLYGLSEEERKVVLDK
ncbi:MAG: TaqI-like C-terminal specificity domain-containing protein [Candidatus Absconditabacteria bacterium]|nr:TaqI-like C-terminal specificity domain-containing protein [Candidatus Absconditabacteria bacterium]